MRKHYDSIYRDSTQRRRKKIKIRVQKIEACNKENQIMKKRILFISFCVWIVGFIHYLRAGKQDIMQVYKVYQKDDSVIVENRKAPNLFKYEEQIFYSDFIEGTYLCTKEKSIARNEKSAFLLVDLGEKGEWWADPFGNLQTDKTVLNEHIPNAFIDEIKEHIHLNWGNSLMQMIDKVEINEWTEREIQRIAPEVYELVHDEEAVLQWYQEVDFDNDNRMDIVVYNKLGMGHGGFTETYFYQQLPGGLYRKTHQINSSGRAIRSYSKITCTS